MEGIHKALNPISWLAGCWHTKEGKGHYPNIQDFEFHDEMEFVCIGQPMFNYMSISHHPAKLTPMHQERGFLRIKPGTNALAFIVSHNFGLTSLEEGAYDVETKQIVLETLNISRTSFAKSPYVKKIKRIFKFITMDTLEVTLFMETDNTPLREHLKAVYKRKDMSG